jgi:hypothetical protein
VTQNVLLDAIHPIILNRQIYQKALFDAGIPYTQFHVDKVQLEYDKATCISGSNGGVRNFSLKPTEMGTR